MLRSRIFLMLALAPVVMTACDVDVAEPANEPEAAVAALASDRDVRAGIEAQLCSGEPDAMNPPPGWPYLYGTSGDDKLVAGEDYAVLIYGRDGDDCLVGGNPNNSLFGEAGDDLLLGNGGIDFLDGGAGADIIFGDDGDDYIVAEDGPDLVFAGKGRDIVYAQDGAVDEIDCGPGFDVAFVDPDDIVRRCERINPPDYF